MRVETIQEEEVEEEDSNGDDVVDAKEDIAALEDDPAEMEVESDAVVSLALRNYENYHGLENGTATYDQVRGSSAGIQGWPSTVINRSPTDAPARANDKAGEHEGKLKA
ncbi:expressed unknown protein [Seminavis robusta]|uniref:Uncharacterized protein n=1 Tax=Seminavis robusta TaxID=568900 RepID=A0A9N8DVS0_9STRA|nr:expressed unknown protein [Seminavis robusta]|eukprot:Sro409_g137110.1 n/a (109) ;mRNA; r:10729-11055